MLISFFGVWWLTGTMERIPAQTLVLLGISGASGLAAIFVGGDTQAELDQRILATWNRLEQLNNERQRLEQERRVGTLSAADETRLLSLILEIETRTHELKALSPRGFWYDIVNDGNGLSFDRAQAVGWTLVLGAIIVSEVMQVMPMPEFADTLLVLMGISNATYIGFKIREKIGRVTSSDPPERSRTGLQGEREPRLEWD